MENRRPARAVLIIGSRRGTERGGGRGEAPIVQTGVKARKVRPLREQGVSVSAKTHQAMGLGEAIPGGGERSLERQGPVGATPTGEVKMAERRQPLVEMMPDSPPAAIVG